MSINYLKEATNPQARERALKSSVLTLSLSGEDHTLGNLLRARLSQLPEVEFTSYSMPHPSLPELNYRLQVHESKVALDIFKQGLDDLLKLTKAISNRFDAEVAAQQSCSRQQT